MARWLSSTTPCPKLFSVEEDMASHKKCERRKEMDRRRKRKKERKKLKAREKAKR
jgi:hypothetical protein